MSRNMQWILLLTGVAVIVMVMAIVRKTPHAHAGKVATALPARPWEAPDTATLPRTPAGDQVRYGRALVAQTAYYLGPKGIVRAISNGMNCQNCHLDAGTRPWGNNYSAVAATYPRYRDRSGSVETIEKRINDCLQRSLNGQPLESDSRELKAMVAYIQWVGSQVPPGQRPPGAGICNLPYPDGPADPEAGKIVFARHCQRCHGANGEGMWDTAASGFRYPPLWGAHSFNTAAGIYRLSRMAGYVRDNMPYGEAWHYRPVLTNEEAWQVAAYLIAQPRPAKTFAGDWPRIGTKPVDHPFGPYDDTFSQRQHQFGPFQPIIDYREKMSRKMPDSLRR